MSQFGTLSGADQTTFKSRQSSLVREPSFVCWIEGISDPTSYILSIDAEQAIESPRGRGHINIGTATLKASNEDNTFYASGASTVQKNARMKVWAGFGDLRIPIFSGYIRSVKPIPESNNVTISCNDYMGLFLAARVRGSQDPNNTIKLIIESFCSDIAASSNITSTDETTEVLTQPKFEPQRMLFALEECSDAIFHVPLFDEDGTLQFYEREYSNYVDWVYDADNVDEDGCRILAPTDIINSIDVEYRENYIARYQDQASIDSYRLHEDWLRLLILNSTEVASKTTGSTVEELDYDLEGFKFTSASGVANIDTVKVMMQQSGASGNMPLKIYTDSAGDPDTLLGTSKDKASNDLSSWGWAWEAFHFDPPIAISPSTAYWGIVDTSSVTGTVYVRISAATATGLHTHDDSGWTAENDKQILFIARQSLQAQRVAKDVVRFFKSSKERVRIVAPAVPQLQLLDQVLIDISTPVTVVGRYKIVGRQHRIMPEGYSTTDTLEAA